MGAKKEVPLQVLCHPGWQESLRLLESLVCGDKTWEMCPTGLAHGKVEVLAPENELF